MLSIDLSAVVGNFSTAYTVRRGGAPTLTAGVYTPAAAVSIEIQALIYPMTGKELQRLPEGERAERKITIFTAEELRTANQGANTPADVVEYNGFDWEVDKVERWNPQGKYWQCVATMRGAG